MAKNTVSSSRRARRARAAPLERVAGRVGAAAPAGAIERAGTAAQEQVAGRAGAAPAGAIERAGTAAQEQVAGRAGAAPEGAIGRAGTAAQERAAEGAGAATPAGAIGRAGTAAHERAAGRAGAALARRDSGSAALGFMLAFAAVLCASLVLLEFMRVFAIKQSVEVELSRAVNTAVNMSMSDAYRQDRLSSLDEGKARLSFYAYLSENMGVSDDFRIYDKNGNVACGVSVDSLSISERPPRVEARLSVSVKPAFLGRLYPGDIVFRVRESSVNRRKDE